MPNKSRYLSFLSESRPKPTPEMWRSSIPAQMPLPGAKSIAELQEEYKSFWVVAREPGSEGGVCEVWASDEHMPPMDEEGSQDRRKRLEFNAHRNNVAPDPNEESTPRVTNEYGVTREDIPLGVDPYTGKPIRTAMLLSNVLSPEECDRICAVAENMGFKNDATVVLNRQVRQNLMLPWIMPDSVVNETIFKRIESLVPQSVLLGHSEEGKGIMVGPPVGVNRRVHFYKYTDVGDHFKKHHDGSRSESPGLTQDKHKIVEDRAHGSRHTFMTLLVYLDDDFTGGETEFFTADADVKVQPKKGSVLAFFHGDHPESQLHAGCAISSGKKTIAWCGLEYDVSSLLQS